MTGLRSSSWISGAAVTSSETRSSTSRSAGFVGRRRATVAAQQPRAAELVDHLAGIRVGERMQPERRCRPGRRRARRRFRRRSAGRTADPEARRRSSRRPPAPSAGPARRHLAAETAREIVEGGAERRRHRRGSATRPALGLVQQRGSERLERDRVAKRCRRTAARSSARRGHGEPARTDARGGQQRCASSAVVHPPPRPSTRSTICADATPDRTDRARGGGLDAACARHSPVRGDSRERQRRGFRERVAGNRAPAPPARPRRA